MYQLRHGLDVRAMAFPRVVSLGGAFSLFVNSWVAVSVVLEQYERFANRPQLPNMSDVQITENYEAWAATHPEQDAEENGNEATASKAVDVEGFVQDGDADNGIDIDDERAEDAAAASEDVNFVKQQRVMDYQEAISQALPKSESDIPSEAKQQRYVPHPMDGLLKAATELGSKVSSGELIAEIELAKDNYQSTLKRAGKQLRDSANKSTHARALGLSMLKGSRNASKAVRHSLARMTNEFFTNSPLYPPSVAAIEGELDKVAKVVEKAEDNARTVERRAVRSVRKARNILNRKIMRAKAKTKNQKAVATAQVVDNIANVLKLSADVERAGTRVTKDTYTVTKVAGLPAFALGAGKIMQAANSKLIEGAVNKVSQGPLAKAAKVSAITAGVAAVDMPRFEQLAHQGNKAFETAVRRKEKQLKLAEAQAQAALGPFATSMVAGLERQRHASQITADAASDKFKNAVRNGVKMAGALTAASGPIASSSVASVTTGAVAGGMIGTAARLAMQAGAAREKKRAVDMRTAEVQRAKEELATDQIEDANQMLIVDGLRRAKEKKDAASARNMPASDLAVLEQSWSSSSRHAHMLAQRACAATKGSSRIARAMVGRKNNIEPRTILEPMVVSPDVAQGNLEKVAKVLKLYNHMDRAAQDLVATGPSLDMFLSRQFRDAFTHRATGGDVSDQSSPVAHYLHERR